MTETTDYVDLKDIGLLEITGPQSAEFLQGQLTCDVTEVTSTQSRLGMHCNAKGRVLATFRLFYRAPHYYLLLPYSMVDLLLKDLKKYALFYKVTLENKSDAFKKIGLVGQEISETLTNYAEFKCEKNETYTHDNTTLLSIPGIILRVILLSRAPTLDSTHSFSIKPFSFWETIDIQSQIASVYPETREIFTPHHLNYHQQGGISFTKGCYTGQEVIARMHYLGKLKQGVYQFDFMTNAPPKPGSDIVDAEGNLQGTLVMTTPLSESDSTYKALGVLRDTAITEHLYCYDTPLQRIEKSVD